MAAAERPPPWFGEETVAKASNRIGELELSGPALTDRNTWCTGPPTTA
jgi:hypothetical protein